MKHHDVEISQEAAVIIMIIIMITIIPPIG